MPAQLDDLRRRALALVQAEYEAAGAVAHVDIDVLNRERPPSTRYRDREEVVREWLNRAGGIATFAVNLGLLTADQARQAIIDFERTYPGLATEPDRT